MGQDKALLEWQGKTLVARACDLLAEVCREVAVADRGRAYQTHRLSLPDGPGHGPVAGLLGAAAAFPGRSILALACDMPHIPIALLTWLAHEPSPRTDLCLPVWERGREPLCALLRPRALAALETRVRKASYSLISLADTPGLNTCFLEGDRLEAFGRPESMFANLNDPRALLELERCRPRS